MRTVRKVSGFTIVELLIVIVVIGILSTIVVVAYNGVMQSAKVNAITTELNQWAKLFGAYKAANGDYPLPSATPTTGGGPGTSVLDRYCLGTGFPQVAGNGYCYLIAAGNIYSVSESTGASLLTQLSTVGTPPANSKKYPTSSVVGPWFRYVSATDQRIGATYPGGTTCPSDMIQEYSGGGRVDCFLRLN